MQIVKLFLNYAIIDPMAINNDVIVYRHNQRLCDVKILYVKKFLNNQRIDNLA
jgi:hypothetical protein